MGVLKNYEKLRKDLTSKMQTLQEFEKSDELVKRILDISRLMLEKGGYRTKNIEWLLDKGNELVQYAGIVEFKSNESWGEYKVAEIAFKSVRDALMLASKTEHSTITGAKAYATRATQDAEVDAIAREQSAKNYATAASICNRMVMFIQTTVRWREQEYAKVNFSERGNRK